MKTKLPNEIPLIKELRYASPLEKREP